MAELVKEKKHFMSFSDAYELCYELCEEYVEAQEKKLLEQCLSNVGKEKATSFGLGYKEAEKEYKAYKRAVAREDRARKEYVVIGLKKELKKVIGEVENPYIDGEPHWWTFEQAKKIIKREVLKIFK